MQIRSLLASGLLGCFAWIPSARGAESVPGAAPRAPTVAGQQHSAAAAAASVSSWYGWQTLSTDGAAVLLAVATSRARNDNDRIIFGATSLALYTLGGPIVHLTHDNGWQALGSLLLRGGLPVTGAGIGIGLERCGNDIEDDFCGLSGAVLGGLAGMVGAMVIDSAVLGWERSRVQAEDGPRLGVALDGQSTLLTASGRF